MALLDGFLFGNTATWDFPFLKVEKPASSHFPARRYQTYTIPGRNGDLHVDEGVFQNYIQSYQCWYYTKNMTNDDAHAIKQWLLAKFSYQRLVDSSDPDRYRLAKILDSVEIENRGNIVGRFTVNFSCDPRSFSTHGDQPISVDRPTVLQNDGFPALPIIKVYGTGDGTITVGAVTVELFSLSGDITLDCEMQNAYRDVGGVLENMNMHIYAPEFPVLAPGENPISWTGGVERVEIIPRWWTT